MAKKVVDFKHRKAKVGKKLAPVNETRIEVKFGSLDVVRTSLTSAAAVAASEGDSTSAAHLTLQSSLQHCRHHSLHQREEALTILRGLCATSPGLVQNNLMEVLASVGGMLVDLEAPLRARAAILLSELYGNLPPESSGPYVPIVKGHLCSALARAHPGTRLDAVGAVALLLRASSLHPSSSNPPLALQELSRSVIPHLVNLMEPQLHAAGLSVSLAAGVVPRVYGIGSDFESVGLGLSGSATGREKEAGGATVMRRKAGGRESRLAVAYCLRRALQCGRDSDCGDAEAGQGVVDLANGWEDSGTSHNNLNASCDFNREMTTDENTFMAAEPTALCGSLERAHSGVRGPVAISDFKKPGSFLQSMTLPIALEAICHLVGLFLEHSTVGEGGNSVGNLHARALLVHTLTLVVKVRT